MSSLAWAADGIKGPTVTVFLMRRASLNDVLACRQSCLASTQLLPGATGRKTGAGEGLTSSGVKRRPSILSASVNRGVLGSPESTVNTG